MNSSLKHFLNVQSNWVIHENVWFSKENIEVTSAFKDSDQDQLFDIEDHSWWFKYRGKCIKGIAEKYINKDHFICDIGGGNGYTTKLIQNTGKETFLIEPSPQACYNASKRGINNIICGTLNNKDFADKSIDSCLLLDVLEHIEDDATFLELIHQKLKSGGELLITVPAFNSLWSNEDVYAGHFKRYSKKQLCELLKKHKFEILYINYFFSFLYFPILFFRVFKDKFTKKKELKIDAARKQLEFQSKFVSFFLNKFEKLEHKRLFNNKRNILGSSIITVVRKNDTF